MINSLKMLPLRLAIVISVLCIISPYLGSYGDIVVSWYGDTDEKFTAAVGFLCVSLMQLCFWRWHKEEHPTSLCVAVLSTWCFLFTFVVMVSAFTNVWNLNELVNFHNGVSQDLTIDTGVPSSAAVVILWAHFLLYFVMSMTRSVYLLLGTVGIMTLALSVCVLLGHAFSNDTLRFYIPTISTAMAIPAAVTALLTAIVDFQLHHKYGEIYNERR